MSLTFIQAWFWGAFAGSALIVGATIAYLTNISQRWVAATMAFGSGVLISALSFELMDEAFQHGGFLWTGFGFVLGAIIYTLANWWLSCKGAQHRKRSNKQPSEKQQQGSGTAIAIGALLDGIPESLFIGLSFMQGAKMSVAAVLAIFISNIPEGLSSTAGMKRSGRSSHYIFGMWFSMSLLFGFASLFGCFISDYFSEEIIAATMALAAGAILAMISDTMMPEAFEIAHNFAGLITVLGFFCAFTLSKLAI